MIRKMVDTQRCFCIFGHKSPTVVVPTSELHDEGLQDVTNIAYNSMNAPDFFNKLTPRTSEFKHNRRIRFTELDDSQSIENDQEYDMNPASSF